jgi:hypothetical protein
MKGASAQMPTAAQRRWRQGQSRLLSQEQDTLKDVVVALLHSPFRLVEPLGMEIADKHSQLH